MGWNDSYRQTDGRLHPTAAHAWLIGFHLGFVAAGAMLRLASHFTAHFSALHAGAVDRSHRVLHANMHDNVVDGGLQRGGRSKGVVSGWWLSMRL